MKSEASKCVSPERVANSDEAISYIMMVGHHTFSDNTWQVVDEQADSAVCVQAQTTGSSPQ
ncbi:hypothetical protein FH972_022930 [Carpinus fangiana]|uniref:Uncharacterized protein n=1 Tax=Carpinus fangiana TaxID=176857 RepID=A0A5N6KVX8_9ROSI|nr:hypothetical protein FH972_022930 [Carpinus fangiana]